jgi:hypothetical protein
MGKHSSLLRTFVNYSLKRIYKIGSRSVSGVTLPPRDYAATPEPPTGSRTLSTGVCVIVFFSKDAAAAQNTRVFDPDKPF